MDSVVVVYSYNFRIASVLNHGLIVHPFRRIVSVLYVSDVRFVLRLYAYCLCIACVWIVNCLDVVFIL